MQTVKLGLLVISAAFVLLAVAILPQKPVFEGGDSYTFFVGDTSKDCKVVTVTDNAALTKLCLSNINGESATYKSLNIEQFLASVNGNIKFTETTSDSTNYYCSADLPYSIDLRGERINLHICVKADGVTVASPIIFGGY